MNLSVVLLLAAAVCVHAAPNRLQTSHLYVRPPLAHDACQTCMDVINELETYATDNQTQEDIVSWIDSNVCVGLPQEFADACIQEAPVLVAQAMDMLKQALTAGDLCSVLGACSGTLSAPHLVHGTFLAAPLECPICKMVATIFIKRLRDPATRERMEGNAQGACAELDTQLARDKCMMDVESLFDAVDAVLDDVDPQKACEIAEFCDDEQSSSFSTDVSKHQQGSDGAKQLKELAGKLVNVPKSYSDETCDTCMEIVQQAAAVLEDPNTQKEIMDYAREGCDMLQEFQQQCHQYVNQYGPLVIGMAISYLQPEPFCERLGYCEAPKLA